MRIAGEKRRAAGYLRGRVAGRVQGTRRNAFLVTVLLPTFGAAGCGPPEAGVEAGPETAAVAEDTVAAPPPATLADFDAEILEFHPQGPSGHAEVRGVVRNPTSRRFTELVVEIDLYGEDGEVVGSAEVQADGLAPSGVLEFASRVPADGARSARITAIIAH